MLHAPRTSIARGRGWAAALFALSLSACCLYSAPGYEGPPRPNLRDGEFYNTYPLLPEKRSATRVLRWLVNRNRGYWAGFTPSPEGAPPPAEVLGSKLRVTFVNHSTLLVQTQGMNVLTDPVWSDVVGPESWLGVSRRRPPGIAFEALPPIDALIISHNHYDHLDLPTLERLERAHRPRFIVASGNAALLRDAGFSRVTELYWWEQHPLSACVRVHAVPAQHFSGRGLCDSNETLWAGYVLDTCGGPVYFAGDTGLGTHFAEIRRRFGKLRASLLPIAAYRPEWFMSPVHIDPEGAVLAHLTLESQVSIAMHFGTFAQADDGQYEPFDALERALRTHGVGFSDFWVLGFGEGRQVPALAP